MGWIQSPGRRARTAITLLLLQPSGVAYYSQKNLAALIQWITCEQALLPNMQIPSRWLCMDALAATGTTNSLPGVDRAHVHLADSISATSGRCARILINVHLMNVLTCGTG